MDAFHVFQITRYQITYSVSNVLNSSFPTTELVFQVQTENIQLLAKIQMGDNIRKTVKQTVS